MSNVCHVKYLNIVLSGAIMSLLGAYIYMLSPLLMGVIVWCLHIHVSSTSNKEHK
jgi:hypothetical protein